jgi:hypothetical protein
MAEHSIVGITRLVCMVKAPDTPPSDDDGARLLSGLTLIGMHNEAPIVLVAPDDIPKLRKLGAEVTVIDNDGNHYAARVLATSSPDDLVASVEESVAKGKADLAIAQAGGGDSGNGKA